MKSLFIFFLLIPLSSSYADEGRQQGQRFEKVKEMALKATDERISALQKVKSCISGAQKRSDMKKCRQEAKALRKQNRAKFKEQMKMIKKMRRKRKNRQSNEQ